MHGLLKQPGYRLYPPDSPEAAALLAEQGLGPADLDRAFAVLERTEATTARIIPWPSTRTGCSRPTAQAGIRTCRMPATSP